METIVKKEEIYYTYSGTGNTLLSSIQVGIENQMVRMQLVGVNVGMVFDEGVVGIKNDLALVLLVDILVQFEYPIHTMECIHVIEKMVQWDFKRYKKKRTS